MDDGLRVIRVQTAWKITKKKKKNIKEYIYLFFPKIKERKRGERNDQIPPAGGSQRDDSPTWPRFSLGLSLSTCGRLFCGVAHAKGKVCCCLIQHLMIVYRRLQPETIWHVIHLSPPLKDWPTRPVTRHKNGNSTTIQYLRKEFVFIISTCCEAPIHLCLSAGLPLANSNRNLVSTINRQMIEPRAKPCSRTLEFFDRRRAIVVRNNKSHSEFDISSNLAPFVQHTCTREFN